MEGGLVLGLVLSLLGHLLVIPAPHREEVYENNIRMSYEAEVSLVQPTTRIYSTARPLYNCCA